MEAFRILAFRVRVRLFRSLHCRDFRKVVQLNLDLTFQFSRKATEALPFNTVEPIPAVGADWTGLQMLAVFVRHNDHCNLERLALRPIERHKNPVRCPVGGDPVCRFVRFKPHLRHPLGCALERQRPEQSFHWRPHPEDANDEMRCL
jgi:hypothetical protein